MTEQHQVDAILAGQNCGIQCQAPLSMSLKGGQSGSAAVCPGCDSQCD